MVVALGQQAIASFTLDDFAVDAAHANPNDPHEVFFPDFNNFALIITGEFDVSKCYEVRITRRGQSDCGAATASDTGTAIVSTDELAVDIHSEGGSDFERGDDWELVVSERVSGCGDTTRVRIHPIPLRIAGCNLTCLLEGTAIAVVHDVGVFECEAQLCATVANSSGNLRYEWELTGDGAYDDAITFTPVNCVGAVGDGTVMAGVRVTDLGTTLSICSESSEIEVTLADPTCDDGNSCTDDSCDSDVGCVHVNNTDPCDDNNACTTNDICSEGGCVGGPFLDCNDDNSCTDDSCNPASGCVNDNNTASCDDDDACTTNDVCSGGVCVGGLAMDCDDGNVCTEDSCNAATGCDHVPLTGDACDDGDACTDPDTCDAGTCIGFGDYTDDDDCASVLCDTCPGRDDCRFGLPCPDISLHVSVLQEPSCDIGIGGSCTAVDPPVPCPDNVMSLDFYVEVWVTKFSPDLNPDPPHNPGIACAYTDVLSNGPVESTVGIEFGELFTSLQSGAFDGVGNVDELGACSFAGGGVGHWNEWVLLARVHYIRTPDDDLSFELAAADEPSAIYGTAEEPVIDYGERCDSAAGCPWCVYDCDGNCHIDGGDFACFLPCWGLCEDDADYYTAIPGGCGQVNFWDCEADDCVDSIDFALFTTAWDKFCDDPTIIWPPECDAALRDLPPLPSDDTLRSFGVEPPPADWKGYRRGALSKLRRTESERRSIKDRATVRGSVRGRGKR